MGGRKLLKTKYCRGKPLTKLTTLIARPVKETDGRAVRHERERIDKQCEDDSDEYDDEVDLEVKTEVKERLNNLQEEKDSPSNILNKDMPKKVASVIPTVDMNIEPANLYKMLDQYFESRDKLKTVKKQKDISEKEKQKLERKAEREKLAAAKAEAKKAERELELAKIKEELRLVVLQKEKEANDKLTAVKRNMHENISKVRSGLYTS